ncbi:MAG: 50S ribosomal protein L11 methyltransferase [Burkholderiales bacterium]
MPWISITLELGLAQAELMSEALLEVGADSVSLEPTMPQPDTVEPDTTHMRLTALAPAGADAAAIVAAAADAAALAAPQFSVARIADEDWVRLSQAQFGPIRAGERLWIVPSWHTPPEEAGLVLRLDPGLAFGTGSHPSTRLVLRQLESKMRAGASVLDYGCGSGILAIAAAKLGAGEIAAVDIDPQALVATAQNAAANGASVKTALPDELPAHRYDVVLANILAGPLISLAPRLAAYTRPGGWIALSGILESQAGEVVAAYAPEFEVAASAIEEGWALVEGRRR